MPKLVYVTDCKGPKAFELATHRVSIELGGDEMNRLVIRNHANVIVYATDDPVQFRFFLGMFAVEISKG